MMLPIPLLKVTLVTPYSELLNVKAVSLVLPGSCGQLQILPGHTNLMTSLECGLAEIVLDEDHVALFALSGGFVEVHEHHVAIMAETAESGESIDIERATEAKQRAEEALCDPQLTPLLEERWRRKLDRANVRILAAKKAG